MPNDETFKNIDYKNKAKAVPYPDRINDIDTKHTLYNNIIDAADNRILDLTDLNSFTTISQSRDEVYNLIDMMAQDPIISVALDIYTSDACEPNEQGQIVWAEADDERVLGEVEHLLDSMNVDKNIFSWVYSLVKYGDVYLRLYRNSEYNAELFKKSEILNENVIIKAYKENDHFAEYMEMIKNPAEVFDLQRFGKTVGFIRSHIQTRAPQSDDYFQQYTNLFKYNFNSGDVDLYPATDLVHACLEDNSSRTEEEVSITNEGDSELESSGVTYSVKRGQSILYNIYKIWRELSLLENSVMLNRITKSSIIRTVQIEVGDMEKNDVQKLLHRVKQMIEQRSSLSKNLSYENYTNPGPVENVIYVPTHDGKGALTTGQIGGDVNVGDLVDLDYFKNKLYGALGIPKQYLGDTDDATGFNGGTALSLTSSRYAKTVKRVQNAIIQALTDSINLMLLDKGLTNYINEFRLKMQAPTTQEEKDRKDNLSSSISNIREIMSLVDGIEDQVTKLNILKSLLSNTISDINVITAIQDEIDRLTEEQEGSGEEGGGEDDFGGDEDFGDLGGDFDLGGGGGGEDVDLDLGGEEELPTPEEAGSAPMEMPEAPEESFSSGEGDLLTEEDNLPNWSDMGLSYNEVK